MRGGGNGTEIWGGGDQNGGGPGVGGRQNRAVGVGGKPPDGLQIVPKNRSQSVRDARNAQPPNFRLALLNEPFT